MKNVIIEHFYLYFQGIILFQVAFFSMLFIITKRKEIVYYCLFIFSNAVYFYINAPNTFFHIDDQIFFNSSTYEIVNYAIIVFSQFIYIIFLIEIFKDKITPSSAGKISNINAILIPTILFVFVLFTYLHIDRNLLFYIGNLLSIPPALFIIFKIKKSTSTFVHFVRLGVISNIFGTVVTVFMIVRYNQGYRSYSFDEYPLLYMRIGILGDIIFYQLAILKKWYAQETELATKHLQSQLEIANIKNQISRELHDDVGTTLSKINLQCYVAQKKLSEEHHQVTNLLGGIQNETQALMQKIRNIMLSPEIHQTDFDLMAVILEYAKPMCDIKGIKLMYNTSSNFPKIQITDKIQLNLIIREAINNAVKYSKCKNIKIDLFSEGEHFKLIISDDGQGFDIHALSRKNGLNNMRYRAESINAFFAIESSPEKSTSIMVEF